MTRIMPFSFKGTRHAGVIFLVSPKDGRIVATVEV